MSWVASRSRLEAFTDGVLAIAITLLVLDLRVPEEPGHFGRQLLDAWPSYLAYVAAFVIIGSVWHNHHVLLSRVRHVDAGVVGRNLVLLLATSVLPFPTAVVSAAWRDGDDRDKAAALLLFGLVSVAASGAWIVLCSYLARHRELLVDDAAGALAETDRRRGFVAIGMTVVAVLFAPFAPMATLVLFAVTPVFYLVTLRRLQVTQAAAEPVD